MGDKKRHAYVESHGRERDMGMHAALFLSRKPSFTSFLKWPVLFWISELTVLLHRSKDKTEAKPIKTSGSVSSLVTNDDRVAFTTLVQIQNNQNC